jgi:Transposase DDE domain
VISTVDPETRHGHKTAARGFDGYKGHVGIDPDSEIITGTEVSPGNAGDASVAEDLVADLLPGPAAAETNPDDDGETNPADPAPGRNADGGAGADPASVYGDNAYGTGEFQDRLAEAGIDSKCKTQPPSAADGLFAKDAFDVDLDADTVCCPAGQTTPIRRGKNGTGIAEFGSACAGCPLRPQCTKAAGGRSIRVGRHERRLAEARQRQTAPEWLADYRATRPKVERKIGHLMRRRHGGRRARVRGQTKVAADFSLLAAAVNLARLGVLGLTHPHNHGWATAQA